MDNPDTYDIVTDRTNYQRALEKAYGARIRRGVTVKGHVYGCEDSDRAAFDQFDNVLFRAAQKGAPWPLIPVRTLARVEVILKADEWEAWLDEYIASFFALYQLRMDITDAILAAQTREELDSINTNPFLA
jgi:hypothetical protein